MLTVPPTPHAMHRIYRAITSIFLPLCWPYDTDSARTPHLPCRKHRFGARLGAPMPDSDRIEASHAPQPDRRGWGDFAANGVFGWRESFSVITARMPWKLSG